jgi:DNA-binding beta-propeller fold protein YncE
MVPAAAQDQAAELIMALRKNGLIEIPGAAGSSFDHGAFDPKTRRVFVAHTGRDSVDVIDHDTHRHITTLSGFPEAAGVVADDGIVLVTNRGSASLAWVDAESLKTREVFTVAPRPNGVAIIAAHKLAIVACIGDDVHGPMLEAISLESKRRFSIKLPGRPRWCVTDRAGARVFLAIREPSMVLVARLPDFGNVQHWKVPAGGAHGLEIDHEGGKLYVACDDAVLVEVDIGSGLVSGQWPIAGPPDVTFFNPATGLVHVAIGEPGVVQSIDPRTGRSTQVATAASAHTTTLVPPDALYVFSPTHRGALCLSDA